MRNENYYNVLNTILDNSQSLVLKNDFWMITDSQFIMENELKIDIFCSVLSSYQINIMVGAIKGSWYLWLGVKIVNFIHCDFVLIEGNKM